MYQNKEISLHRAILFTAASIA